MTGFDVDNNGCLAGWMECFSIDLQSDAYGSNYGQQPKIYFKESSNKDL